MPLSTTLIEATPDCSTSTLISVDSASMAFSNNSLTTELGLSTTSPAAILLAKEVCSSFIFPIVYTYLYLNCFCKSLNFTSASIGVILDKFKFLISNSISLC